MSINNQLRYIMYLRKSTDTEDKQVNSLQDQKKELSYIIEREKLNVVAQFQESASAHKEGRKQFALVLEMLKEGKADALLVWHVNRLARNAVDGGQIIKLLDDGKLAEIRSCSGSFRGFPSDLLMLQIEFAISKKKSDDIKIDVQRGVRRKFEDRKEWICLAKPGYLNKRNEETGKAIIVTDPSRFALLKRAGHMIIEGKYTANEVYRKLNEEWGYRTKHRKKVGNRPMAKSTFYRFLSDPYYYGLMVANIGGELKEEYGTHEPMFSKKEWDVIQLRLGKDIRRNVSKHNYPYRGVMVCGECESAIVAQEKWHIVCSECKYKFHKGKNRISCPRCGIRIDQMNQPKIRHYIYYGCTKKKRKPDGTKCNQTHLEIKTLERQIQEYLNQITIDEDYKDWAIEHLNELHDQEANHREVVAKNLNQQIVTVSRKLDNLLQLKISPENIGNSMMSDGQYIEQRKLMMEERDLLMEQLEGLNTDQDEYMKLTKDTFDFACYAKYWFDNGNEEKKTQILQSLGYNLKLKDKKVWIERHKPFFLIKQFNEEVREIIKKVEPKEKIGLKDKNAYSDQICSKLSKTGKLSRTFI